MCIVVPWLFVSQFWGVEGGGGCEEEVVMYVCVCQNALFCCRAEFCERLLVWFLVSEHYFKSPENTSL